MAIHIEHVAETQAELEGGTLTNVGVTDGELGLKQKVSSFRAIAVAYNSSYDGYTNEGALEDGAGNVIHGCERAWDLWVWDRRTGTFADNGYINFHNPSEMEGGVHATYDTYEASNTQSQAFADTIADLDGNFIAIVIADHAPDTRTQVLNDALIGCGGTSAKANFIDRKSYILVGVVGCGEGNAIVEELDNIDSVNHIAEAFFSIDHYPPVGDRLSPAIDLHPVTTVKNSLISWVEKYEYKGIELGYLNDDITFYINQWNGVANNGEIYITGTGFTRYDGTVSYITPTDWGVALSDSLSAEGFLMYSEEDIFTRFPVASFDGQNCHHIIGVLRVGDHWEFDDNVYRYTFTPRTTDCLIAVVGWGITHINKLNGLDITVVTRTSDNGGFSWTPWLECLNGSSIPNLPTDVSGLLFECRQTLTTNDARVTPYLDSLEIIINSSSINSETIGMSVTNEVVDNQSMLSSEDVVSMGIQEVSGIGSDVEKREGTVTLQTLESLVLDTLTNSQGDISLEVLEGQTNNQLIISSENSVSLDVQEVSGIGGDVKTIDSFILQILEPYVLNSLINRQEDVILEEAMEMENIAIGFDNTVSLSVENISTNINGDIKTTETSMIQVLESYVLNNIINRPESIGLEINNFVHRNTVKVNKSIGPIISLSDPNVLALPVTSGMVALEVQETNLGTSVIGYRIETYDLSSLGDITTSFISWNATLNGQRVDIYASLSTDGGVTFSEYASCMNDAVIPGIENIDDPSNMRLRVIQKLTSYDFVTSPVITRMTISINSAKLRAVAQLGADPTGSNVAKDTSNVAGIPSDQVIGDIASLSNDKLDAIINGKTFIVGGYMNTEFLEVGSILTEKLEISSAADSTKIDGGKIWAGSAIQIGNVDGMTDYCLIDEGNIEFFRYIDGQHRLAKSLKRVESGTVMSGSVNILPGYWKSPPNIIVTPAILDVYDANYATQSQKLNCKVQNISETLTTGVYQFEALAELQLSGGENSTFVNERYDNSFPVRSDKSDEISATWYSGTHNTVANVTEITVNGTWDAFSTNYPYIVACTKYHAWIELSIFALIDGSLYHIQDFSGYEKPRFWESKYFSKTFSVASGVHSVAIKFVLHRLDNSGSSACTSVTEAYMDWTFDSFSTNVQAATTAATGTLNYIAIGE